MILSKIVLQQLPPGDKRVLWVRPYEKGFALYAFYNGTWKPLMLTDNKKTISVHDDTPIEDPIGSSSMLGPNTVGSEQIVDNSVKLDDLNEEVRNLLSDIYTSDDETLYVDGSRP